MGTKQVFFAQDTRRGINKVLQTLGPDAVIYSNRRVNGGVEIIAGLNDEPTSVQVLTQHSNQPTEINNNTQQTSATDANPTRPMINEPIITQTTQTKTTGSTQTQVILPEEKSPAPVTPLPEAPREPKLEVKAKPKSIKPKPKKKVQNPVRETSEPLLTKMEQELDLLRDLLNTQLTQCSLAANQKANPTLNILEKYLMQLGFDTDVCNRVVNKVKNKKHLDTALKEALKHLQVMIKTSNNEIIKKGGIIALIGPTGAGKTTTVAKLATRFVLKYSAKNLGLISMDTQRVAAREQLSAYGKILGIPVLSVNNPTELNHTLTTLKDKRLVLIDTAGISPRSDKLQKYMQDISCSNDVIKSYLVLSATNQQKVLDETLERFHYAQPAGSIITKLDESTTLGPILSTLIKHQLPIAYLGDGQSISEDLKVADSSQLVDTIRERM